MSLGKELVAKIKADNQALFKASQINVKAYFDSKPSQQELVDHFVGRMVNERMNMIELSQKVAALPANTPIDEVRMLSKQAFDEAEHFRLVKEVIERITGSDLDVEAAIAAEEAKPTAKGAALLAKYEAETDPLALAAYQLVAEGRAEAVWNTMAECIEDQFISSRYARIAKDEGFHAGIGAVRLERLVKTQEDVARVEEIAAKMRKDLFDISCKNTQAEPEALALVAEAYGW